VSKTTEKATDITVIEVQKGIIEFCIKGSTPLILNTMSEKTRIQLLIPPPKKNAADKASTLKHDPLAEFRASAYTLTDAKAPTYLGFMASAFKAALKGAALDLPGASKSQIGRLTYVEGEYLSLYGIPKLLMSVVRSADMNRTPDIRSRAILSEWACSVRISFVKPLLREQAVINLLAAAGITQGIGDWRPQKGSGSYGQFTLVGHDDADFGRIVNGGGRAAQMSAMNAPECYDDETEKMLSWFNVESKRRGFKVVSNG